MQNKRLMLNYRKPIMAVDGNSIFVSEAGPVNIVFFQVRQETADEVNADVVAAVRLHSVEELRNLQRQINDTIKHHENKDK